MIYIHVAADWADISGTPTKQEKTYLKPRCTPLHTVSWKHVVQPENRSKTLGTGVSLNVPQVSVLCRVFPALLCPYLVSFLSLLSVIMLIM